MRECVAIHILASISYSVRLRVACSTVMGKCQSLKKQNEQQIQTLTLFLFLLDCESSNVTNVS